MSTSSGTGLPRRNKFVASLLLSILLVGSTISSALLIGSSVISQQQAWANHLPAPVLTFPANNAFTDDRRLTFNWNNVSGATSYSFQIDDDPLFGSILITGTNTQSQFRPAAAQALADGTYYWRAAAKANDPDTLGPYSASFTVTIDDTDLSLLI